MSTWLRIRNELKSRPPDQYFTSTQRMIHDELLRRFQFPGKCINLNGPTGSGKTVLAWGLANSLGALYIPQPNDLFLITKANSTILIIDNAPHYEAEIRQLMARINLLDFGSLLIVTSIPTELKMESVTLTAPTLQEVQLIVNLYSYWGFYKGSNNPHSTNLWQIMQDY